MPDVLLFGATGYTGRLTAEALGRRDASFVVAGRDLRSLEELATRTGAADARRAEVGDVEALTAALADCKAIITCVGPFGALGDTAAEAAIRAGVHYVDSTGELDFIDHLITNYGPRATAAGIVMAPSMGFDEVPSDVALSLAVDGLDRPEAVVTYALPTHASTGTLRTMVAGIATTKARWIRDGHPEEVATGSRSRWAPMPPPLGPKLGMSVPLAEGRLAPLHLELGSLELYMTVGRAQAVAMRVGMPVANVALRSGVVKRVLDKALDFRSGGPSETNACTRPLDDPGRSAHRRYVAQRRSSGKRSVRADRRDAGGGRIETRRGRASRFGGYGPGPGYGDGNPPQSADRSRGGRTNLGTGFVGQHRPTNERIRWAHDSSTQR